MSICVVFKGLKGKKNFYRLTIDDVEAKKKSQQTMLIATDKVDRYEST